MKLAARFRLPLRYAPLPNVLLRMHWAQRARLKKHAVLVLLTQGGGRRSKPLAGRPLIRMIRFSTAEPDPTAEWEKVPLDLLKVDKGRGLGLIVDDSSQYVEVETSWVRSLHQDDSRIEIEVFER